MLDSSLSGEVMSSPYLIFSTQSYTYLREAICALGHFEPGLIDRKVFPDGERYQRILTPVKGRDVIFIGGTISDSDTLELYDAACAVAKHEAETLTLIIPYFGYSTMERAVRPGEVVTAKTRARLMSVIPEARDGNRVVLLDLHVSGITHYFEGNIRPVHLYGKQVVLQAIRELVDGDFVLACTDAGRAKWVESLANEIGVKPSFVFKRRIDSETTAVSAVSAQVENQQVIIYDDMIRTGSSLLNAARAYRDAGAKSIAVVTTHGVLPGDSLEKLRASGLIERIICTDSHPRAIALQGDFLGVKSIAGLLADFLKGSSM